MLVWLLLMATTLSGGASLVYETLWTRSLAIILGSTVQAASATFAAFLVGLALGAYLAGRVSNRIRNPAALYVAVEAAIAVLACGTSLLLHQYREPLTVLMGAGGGGWRAATAFLATLALVILPTLFIGATFPILLTSARRLGAPLKAIGLFYGFNTFGAALGTLACGFFFIRTLGVQGSALLAACLNAASALASLPAWRRCRLGSTDPAPVETRIARAPEWMLLLVAVTSGFGVLGLEIAWTRLGSFFLGNRTYAFTVLLACVLTALAVGSWLSSRLVTRYAEHLPLVLGWTLVASAALTVGCTAAAGWWIQHQERFEAALPHANSLLLFYRLAEAAVLLGPMIACLGCLFPMSLTCSRSAGDQTGRAAGAFYLFNTLGSVTGSLLVGFWTISAFGTYGSVALLTLAIGVVGLVVFALHLRERRGAALAGLLASVVVLSLVPAVLPERLELHAEDERVLYHQEDEYGVLQIVQMPDGPVKVTNNRTQLIFYLGLLSTSYVQQMQGHLGMFFQPDSKKALVLGSGYGVTAGALSVYPGIERIDAVEILPGLVEAAELFSPFNLDYHRNPRVRIIVDDGRHFLATSTEHYDVISVNVSDPRLPGGSSLYHADFYRDAKRRLAPGGVVIQHAFGTDLRTVLATLKASFRHIRMYPSYANGFNVVASDEPLVADPERIRRLVEAPPVRDALASIGIAPPLRPELIFRNPGQPQDYPELFPDDAEIATDDHPILEYAWSRETAQLLFSND